MGEHVRRRAGGQRERTSLLASHVARTGWGRRRWGTKARYKCGLCPCYGIRGRIPASSYTARSGTDLGERVSRFLLLNAARARLVSVSVVEPSVSSCTCVWSDRFCDSSSSSQRSAAHCDSPSCGPQHSSVLQGDTSTCPLPEQARCEDKPTPATGHARTTSPRYRWNNPRLLPLLATWLLTYCLLLASNPHLLAQASAVPSTSAIRYRLLPASQHNDTIFIYFNPPSILDLKVNTRQRVYFNFTLYHRQARFGPDSSNTKNQHSHQINKINRTVLDIDSNNSGLALQDVPMNDDTPGSSTTTTTASSSTTTATTTEASGKTFSHQFPSSTPSSASPPLPNTTISSPLLQDSYTHAKEKAEEWNGSSYWVMIYSDDDTIARPVISSPNGLAAAHADNTGSYILMAVSAGRQHNFSVEARHIGRVTMSVAVVDVNGDRRMPQASYVQAVAASQYPVTAVRGERTADLVFNSSVAAIAIIISFGIGAVTDTDSLKRQLKYPVALIIGFCCQFIIMPMLAFGIAMLLPLDKDIRFGLLCVACVPGGGLSHVAVIIADGDTALSLTMNLIGVVAMLGTAPLWIFVLGQYFQADPHSIVNPRMIPIYNFEIWLASTFFAYTAGLIIKRLRPAVADAILMWLIKPFLLLASILYITLGVYINMYVFELVNGYALLGAMLLPLCGCVVGTTLAIICRQSYAFVKTIALETSCLNCLVVMVALRFTLKQPDADLAAMIPIWVMFTIPGFFVFLAICNKVKNVILHFWKNRNAKDNDVQNTSKAYSVSSSVVSPPGTTTLSAPLVATDGLDDDATISTMSNQKVTVL